MNAVDDIDDFSIFREESSEQGEGRMSMLTRIYGRSDVDTAQAPVPQPLEAVPAETLDRGDAEKEDRTPVDRTTDGTRNAVDREREINPVPDIDVPAYFRALDQIKSAFGDMHERLRLSHEATVSLSADALKHMSALHKLEDELSSARHVAEIASAQITELSERLGQEMDRSAALEQHIQESERELQSVSARNHDLETLLRKMHQGLMTAFADESLSSR